MDLFRCAALSFLSLMGYSHQSGSVPISEANSWADHVSCASEETCDIAADGRAVRRIMVSRMRPSTLRYSMSRLATHEPKLHRVALTTKRAAFYSEFAVIRCGRTRQKSRRNTPEDIDSCECVRGAFLVQPVQHSVSRVS